MPWTTVSGPSQEKIREIISKSHKTESSTAIKHEQIRRIIEASAVTYCGLFMFIVIFYYELFGGFYTNEKRNSPLRSRLGVTISSRKLTLFAILF